MFGKVRSNENLYRINRVVHCGDHPYVVLYEWIKFNLCYGWVNKLRKQRGGGLVNTLD